MGCELCGPVCDCDPRKDVIPTALDYQIGGDHYKGMPIQPVEFIQKNRLNYCEGNIVKYICRWREKGGLRDLEKVRHYVDLLIQIEGVK